MSDSLFHPVIDSEAATRALEEAHRQADWPAASIDVDAMVIEQRMDRYAGDDHEAWRRVVAQRMEQLERDGSQVFLAGMDKLRLPLDRVPSLDAINALLEPVTGWRARPVPGYLPSRSFFAFLARRQFPTTISVRPLDRLGYLPEPDILHDVFGHVPLHADPVFADFLQAWGRAAVRVRAAEHVEGLARVFWFTVEFGLIREGGRPRLYGAGLISSPGEGHHALHAAEVDRRPFDLDRVIATPFEIDHYQPILYVLESFDQLRDAMRAYAARLEADGAFEHARDAA
ncbi:MAG: phenylalanine 4-monooxygenase [Sandaracinaceae bacterium]